MNVGEGRRARVDEHQALAAWTDQAGLGLTRGEYSGWAAMLFDYDHDGWLDIFNTNGSAQHEYGQENAIYRNRGNGKFENVSDTAGPHFQESAGIYRRRIRG